MPRVVLDTNIVVSALFGGNPRDILMLWYGGRVELCLSDNILAEYSRILRRPDIASEDARQLLSSLMSGFHTQVAESDERIAAITADLSDNMFLECAVAAGADVIVSGDRHLLDLGEFRGIPIVTAAEFLQLHETQ